MNREDIIGMAADAGIIPWTKHEYIGGKNFSASDEGLDGDLASLIQFAALVASAEREACAVTAEKESLRGLPEEQPEGEELLRACAQIAGGVLIADAIRARGQA